jgi:hypothetical protein
MGMISRCIEPGCTTLCIGLFCVAHDAVPQVEFPRGRPWPPVGRAQTEDAGRAAVEPVLETVTPAA